MIGMVVKKQRDRYINGRHREEESEMEPARESVNKPTRD
jgi:hypothetical protein